MSFCWIKNRAIKTRRLQWKLCIVKHGHVDWDKVLCRIREWDRYPMQFCKMLVQFCFVPVNASWYYAVESQWVHSTLPGFSFGLLHKEELYRVERRVYYQKIPLRVSFAWLLHLHREIEGSLQVGHAYDHSSIIRWGNSDTEIVIPLNYLFQALFMHQCQVFWTRRYDLHGKRQQTFSTPAHS